MRMVIALDIDEEIGLEEKEDNKEIDESTIKRLCNITDICTRYNSKFGLESSNEDSNDEDDSENYDDTLLPPDLDQIEKQFKIAISNFLNKYWHDFCEVGLVATFLDSQTKKMAVFTNREQEKAKTKLRNEFEDLHLNITSND
ncbi:5275_t:CDS:2 [Gigaspora margarita]|uniref:5275_t:CDS:1 n=1 Tax=Gigaspora margarita TaxID=4874 RepID=A0ABN7UX68_GIGMA|nr:5275_t:CDS:2 [Gigaspora margarita]